MVNEGSNTGDVIKHTTVFGRCAGVEKPRKCSLIESLLQYCSRTCFVWDRESQAEVIQLVMCWRVSDAV